MPSASSDSAPSVGNMLIDERFTVVAAKFFAMFRRRRQGGGGLAVYLHGAPVLDIWAGWADGDRRWHADTLALSYSTGKGVAATVVHRLAERGVLDYDAPVATYWPEFAAQGKDAITVRDVLNHRAGLQRTRGLLDDPADLLDHDAVAAAIAASAPDPLRLRASGYHGLTFGTIVAEIAQRATGRAFTELVRTELAEPLGDNDFYFGVPQQQRHRLAKLSPRLGVARVPFDRMIAPFASLRMVHAARGAVYDGWADMTLGDQPYDAMMPGWNGVFTARALAEMYGAIANDGTVGHRRLLRPETTRLIARMPPNGRFDYVLGAAPHFALGYHRGIVGTKLTRQALGHFGIGGSGGIAMPGIGLSVAFVTNHLGNHAMSLGDARLPVLAALAQRAALGVEDTGGLPDSLDVAVG
ncbi:CubicO group peptidase (beta-lactamase class C family) [Nocardia tenerifensis]|uniref:CubicO group peptidase (Beta-lactamase class C family) n=1 Tax=Nocardia tenerifensis TaxID=228006 RepID=A0A318JZG6_9NOCA|nr:serine hydrolase domain-containing protein [Nocardia tenerifensis]PXX59861.1 CubicO group peptidase (beta-lactamase class C family) [Nocardia tenerifensis]